MTWTARKECAILCTVAPAVRQLHFESGNERVIKGFMDIPQNSDSWLGRITPISDEAGLHETIVAADYSIQKSINPTYYLT